MKYLSKKNTFFLLIFSFLTLGTIYYLPILFESMLLQKIVSVSYIVIAVVLGVLFMLVNGSSSTIVDGEYEKNYYNSLKQGKAVGEGENLHWNPLNLSLAKRIYYAKIIICVLCPIVALFFIDYVYLLISLFE